MKANVKQIRKRRSYSKEFKQQLVDEFESGQYSVLQLSKLHKITEQVIYRWIYKFSTYNEKGYRVVENIQSSQEKLAQMEKRIYELEAALGRKQIIIDFQDKMFELGKEEFGVDLKKNYGTQPLITSGKTHKK